MAANAKVKAQPFLTAGSKRLHFLHASANVSLRFKDDEVVRRHVAEMEQKVSLGLLAPGTAADKLLDLFFTEKQTS